MTALSPVMRERESAWIGWGGDVNEHLNPFRHDRINEQILGTKKFEDLLDSRLKKAIAFCDLVGKFDE